MQQKINNRFARYKIDGESEAFRRFRYQFNQLFKSDEVAKTDTEFNEVYVHDEDFERAIEDFKNIPTNATTCVIGYTGIGKSTCIRHCFSIGVRKDSFIDSSANFVGENGSDNRNDSRGNSENESCKDSKNGKSSGKHKKRIIFPTFLDGYTPADGERYFDISNRIYSVCETLMETFPDLVTLMKTAEGKEAFYNFIRKHTGEILEGGGLSSLDKFDMDRNTLIRAKLKVAEAHFKYQYNASLLKFFISRHYDEINELVIILDDVESLPDDFQESTIEAFLKFYECMKNTDYPETLHTTTIKTTEISDWDEASAVSATSEASEVASELGCSESAEISSGEAGAKSNYYSIKLLIAMRPHTYRRYITSRQMESFGANIPILKEHSVPLNQLFAKRFNYYTKSATSIAVIKSWQECKESLDSMNRKFNGQYMDTISKLCFYDVRKSLSRYAMIFANRFWIQENRAKKSSFSVKEENFDFSIVNVIRALACQENEVFFDSEDGIVRNIFFTNEAEDYSILSLMVIKYFIKKTEYDYYGVDEKTESIKDVIQFWTSICGKEIANKVREIIDYLFDIKVLRKSIRNREDSKDQDKHTGLKDESVLYISPRGIELFNMLRRNSILFEMLREASWRDNSIYHFNDHSSNELIHSNQRDVIFSDLLEYISYLCEQEDDILNQVKARGQIKTFTSVFGYESLCYMLWQGVEHSLRTISEAFYLRSHVDTLKTLHALPTLPALPKLPTLPLSDVLRSDMSREKQLLTKASTTVPDYSTILSLWPKALLRLTSNQLNLSKQSKRKMHSTEDVDIAVATSRRNENIEDIKRIIPIQLKSVEVEKRTKSLMNGFRDVKGNSMEIRFNNGTAEVFVDGTLVDKARILSIFATYSEDREELIDIVRMTELNIEYDNQDFEYESEVWNKVWNDLCVLEYNAVDDDNASSYPEYEEESIDVSDSTEEQFKNQTWQDEARADISNYTGLNEDYIEIEF